MTIHGYLFIALETYSQRSVFRFGNIVWWVSIYNIYIDLFIALDNFIHRDLFIALVTLIGCMLVSLKVAVINFAYLTFGIKLYSAYYKLKRITYRQQGCIEAIFRFHVTEHIVL